jgi:hypothetical protein
MVTVHPSEQARVEGRGGIVIEGFLQPREGCRGCPFKKDGLCGLHFTPDKPFGCIASPFTLNGRDTLIVRNRYKMLPCYRGKAAKEPAYKAFFSSLSLLFGVVGAEMLVEHFDNGGNDLIMDMFLDNYQRLKDNDEAKRHV